MGCVKVIIKTVINSRADTEFRIGEKFLYGGCKNM